MTPIQTLVPSAPIASTPSLREEVPRWTLPTASREGRAYQSSVEQAIVRLRQTPRELELRRVDELSRELENSPELLATLLSQGVDLFARLRPGLQQWVQEGRPEGGQESPLQGLSPQQLLALLLAVLQMLGFPVAQLAAVVQLAVGLLNALAGLQPLMDVIRLALSVRVAFSDPADGRQALLSSLGLLSARPELSGDLPGLWLRLGRLARSRPEARRLILEVTARLESGQSPREAQAVLAPLFEHLSRPELVEEALIQVDYWLPNFRPDLDAAAVGALLSRVAELARGEEEARFVQLLQFYTGLLVRNPSLSVDEVLLTPPPGA